MKSYQQSSFEDRAGQAAEAKQKALDQLRSKPKMDPSIVAERQAASARRAAAEDEKRAARKAAEQAEAAEKAEQAARAAAELAAVKPEPTEQERKLARDARYAARKNRK